MASEHVRRSKVVRFIRTRLDVIDETKKTLRQFGKSEGQIADYAEPLEDLLDKLREEFKIEKDELQ